MWISRKKFEEIKQRIADLEGQVQGQQKVDLVINKKELSSKIGKSTVAINGSTITAQVL